MAYRGSRSIRSASGGDVLTVHLVDSSSDLAAIVALRAGDQAQCIAAGADDGKHYTAVKSSTGLAWVQQASGSGGSTATTAQVRAVIESVISFDLSTDHDTLTANSNGALGTLLVLGYTMPVGSKAFVRVDGVADGLWTVAVEGDAGTEAVLTRDTDYLTAASLPVSVVAVSPLSGHSSKAFLLAGTPGTPGDAALPYYPADDAAHDLAAAIQPSQIAVAGATEGAVRIAQLLTYTLPALAPGTADDVTCVVPDSDFHIAAAWCDITAAVAGTYVQARTAANGAGTVLSAHIPTADTGRQVEETSGGPSVGSRVLAALSTFYVRRPDRAVGGTFYLLGYRS